MSDLTNDPFAQSVREALLNDQSLVDLLGGRHVFDEPPPNANYPYITINQTKVPDWSQGGTLEGERSLTVQVWPDSGDKSRMQQLLETAHDALDAAGLISGTTPIRLFNQYSGSRKLPDGEGFHGILRYRAERQSEAI